jgi:nitrogenase molybdenum-iron protein alpha/beta subunit
MDAKEKAEELVLKFMRLQEPNYNWFHSKLAKQCALIAVDEILDNFGSLVGDKTHYCNYLTTQYYQEVKEEIEKL